MQASSQKPAGLNSGEAIRSYDDISSDRAAYTSKKYDRVFIDLAYLMVETAMDIQKRTGKYTTVYPNKDGTKEVDLPELGVIKNRFVIKCFNESMLPRTPAGRIQTVTEMVTSGMLTLKEGQRLMRFPDLEAEERLANASEERIFKTLDAIVEKGITGYKPPDEFMDLALATDLCVKYINLYLAAGLEEPKADLLRKFFKQTQYILQKTQPPPMPAGAPPGAPGMPAPAVTPPPAQTGVTSMAS